MDERGAGRLSPSPDEGDVSLATEVPLATVVMLLRAMRRRRRSLVAAAMLGVIAAIGLSLAFPPVYSASTTLLLQPATDGDPAQSILTEVQLLQSRAVAAVAIPQLKLSVAPDQLRRSTRVTVLSSTILRLTVTAPTGPEAVRRARGIADAFLQFRRDEVERESKVEVDALSLRAADINAQLTQTNLAITNFAARPDAKTDAALRDYGDLLSQKATLSNQLGQLQQRIDSVTVAPASSVEKGRVLDTATDDPRSPSKAMAVNALSGLFGAVAILGALIILRELVSDKIRRSDRVAEALWAPAAVTVKDIGGSPRRQRNRFRSWGAAPSPDIAPLLQIWHRLWAHHTTDFELTIVAVESSMEAGLLVACAAAEMARDGRDVVVVDQTEESVLADICRVRSKGSATVQVRRSASTFELVIPQDRSETASPVDLENPPEPDGGDPKLDGRIGFRLIGPAALVESGTSATRRTVAIAVVRAGAVNAPLLAFVRRALSGRGLVLNHVVVVAADADDHGVGRPGAPWLGTAVAPARVRLEPSDRA